MLIFTIGSHSVIPQMLAQVSFIRTTWEMYLKIHVPKTCRLNLVEFSQGICMLILHLRYLLPYNLLYYLSLLRRLELSQVCKPDIVSEKTVLSRLVLEYVLLAEVIHISYEKMGVGVKTYTKVKEHRSWPSRKFIPCTSPKSFTSC